MFMTGVSATYIFYAPEGLQLSYPISLTIGTVLSIIVLIIYIKKIIDTRSHKTTNIEIV